MSRCIIRNRNIRLIIVWKRWFRMKYLLLEEVCRYVFCHIWIMSYWRGKIFRNFWLNIKHFWVKICFKLCRRFWKWENNKMDIIVFKIWVMMYRRLKVLLINIFIYYIFIIIIFRKIVVVDIDLEVRRLGGVRRWVLE